MVGIWVSVVSMVGITIGVWVGSISIVSIESISISLGLWLSISRSLAIVVSMVGIWVSIVSMVGITIGVWMGSISIVSIQSIGISVVPDSECRRAQTSQFTNQNVKFPKTVNLKRPPTKALSSTFKAVRPTLI